MNEYTTGSSEWIVATFDRGSGREAWRRRVGKEKIRFRSGRLGIGPWDAGAPISQDVQRELDLRWKGALAFAKSLRQNERSGSQRFLQNECSLHVCLQQSQNRVG